MRLGPEELLALTDGVSPDSSPWHDVTDGALRERRHRLLARTESYELWIIFWPRGIGLDFHDHGGSSGAFRVLEGVLEEAVPASRAILRTRLQPGQAKGFGPSHIHAVVNPEAAPATSLHAYSPPLSSMTFYGLSEDGPVAVATETEWEGAP